MEAIILAGGFGTRLQSVVSDLPKPMAPIAGRPFLEILLASLAQQGFTRIILSLGYLAHTIIDHFGDTFAGMDLEYEIEQTPLGTGGAIRQAMQKCNSDHVFIFNGDTFLEFNAQIVEQQWLTAQKPIIVACQLSNTERYGRLEHIDNRVTGFSEKGQTGIGLINAGCYVFPLNLLDDFKVAQAFSLENDFLTQAVKQQHFELFISYGHFIDIGIPEDYLRAQTELLILI